MTPIGGIGPQAGFGSPGAPAPVGTTGTDAIGGAAADGQGVATGQATPGRSFLDTLDRALGQLNAQLTGADAAAAQFAAGGSADLHSVMLQMQEASIGLRVGVAVRDRLLEAYQEIMRLQV